MHALRLSFLDGSHFQLTRRIIPQGLGNLRSHKNSSESGLSVESHAILAQTFLATEDFRGLLQVRSSTNPGYIFFTNVQYDY